MAKLGWKLTRKKAILNRHFPTLNDLVTVVHKTVRSEPCRMKSLHDYAQLIKTLRIVEQISNPKDICRHF